MMNSFVSNRLGVIPLLQKMHRPWIKMYWRSRRIHRLSLFGERVTFSNRMTPYFLMGNSRPAEAVYAEDIVAYADYVQWQSIGAALSRACAGPTYVDVGAAQGLYAILLGVFARKLGGTVLACEPDPENFEVLQENVRLNGLESTITCAQVAVSNRSGQMGFLREGSQGHLVSENESDFHVTAMTLGDLFEKHRIQKVNLLLIDVEGAEWQVLEGLPWSSVSPERIYCEMHPYAWHSFGYDDQQVQKFLNDHRLICIDMYHDRKTSPFGTSYIGPTLLVPDSAMALA